ncbi:hypothetical protein CCAX7_14660 [Capsulimonas corticalis]|uniref:Uncharacterized protein n=1 Tax=Capsulimonas corticalis TaxID=2219043 RepID=A0A402CZJ8_9BACT|nr:hypothetical protein [Capsulimonas corticalis]BDI29415.1 hypothetical protein CCAX7_14660 [Capsulimonas corticalis]
MLAMSAAHAAPKSTSCDAAPATIGSDTSHTISAHPGDEYSFAYLFSLGMSLRRITIIKRCSMTEASLALEAYEDAKEESKRLGSSYPLDSFRLYGLSGVPYIEYAGSKRREQLSLAA